MPHLRLFLLCWNRLSLLWSAAILAAPLGAGWKPALRIVRFW
jgi:hypothetical protein